MATTTIRDAARRVLWSEREYLLPHLFEHMGCGVYERAMEVCGLARWTEESYLLAVLFDSAELLVEITK